jgi:hypothetical protein
MRLERGKCYGVVARLGDAAAFGEHARKGSVVLVFRVAGDDVRMGPGIVGPGAVGGGMCPQTTAAATLDLQATFGSAQDKSQIHDLGSGPITLQLYTRAIDGKDLARQKSEAKAQVAATAAAVEARHRQEAAAKDHVCTQCRASFDDCIADWRRGATKKECKREYADCAHQAGTGAIYTWDFCGTGEPAI